MEIEIGYHLDQSVISINAEKPFVPVISTGPRHRPRGGGSGEIFPKDLSVTLRPESFRGYASVEMTGDISLAMTIIDKNRIMR